MTILQNRMVYDIIPILIEIIHSMIGVNRNIFLFIACSLVYRSINHSKILSGGRQFFDMLKEPLPIKTAAQ